MTNRIAPHFRFGRLVCLVLAAGLLMGVLCACQPQTTEGQQASQTADLQQNEQQTADIQPQEETQPDLAALRDTYFDFARQYRLDYIPLFEEGEAPTDSTEYLFWAFAVNLYNWGDEKGVMTRSYVDDVVHNHFEVGDITHQSLRRAWNYDGETYIAEPMGINEEPLYSLSGYSEQQQNGHTVYTITMIQFNYLDMPPSEEDMARYRAAAVSGDLSGLPVMRTELFQFYWNEQTGQPVFLSHTLPAAQAFLDQSDEQELQAIVEDADYLTAFGGLSSFDRVSQLTPADLFNYYAATDSVQSKMNETSDGWVELSVADITSFYAQRFGVSFLPDDLIAQRSTEVLRYGDDSKQTLLLSAVNGGVYWPSAMPYTLAIDSCTPDGDLLTIQATRHYVDETDSIDDVYAITLTLRITSDSYQYVSYTNMLVERNGERVA